MAVRNIILLGDPALYRPSEEVDPGERDLVRETAADLRDTLADFRRRNSFGRAIAAPQIGVHKRIVYMDVGTPMIFVNPVLVDKSPELVEIWDDCMSFPGLSVKVKRHKSCRIVFLDGDFRNAEMKIDEGLSELLQHETDHLDGVLATMRAVDRQSFSMKRA